MVSAFLLVISASMVPCVEKVVRIDSMYTTGKPWQMLGKDSHTKEQGTDAGCRLNQSGSGNSNSEAPR
jgi:hypothetical protein